MLLEEPVQCPGENTGRGRAGWFQFQSFLNQPRDLEQVHSFSQAGLPHPRNQSDNTFLLYPIGLKESSKKTGKTALWELQSTF